MSAVPLLRPAVPADAEALADLAASAGPERRGEDFYARYCRDQQATGTASDHGVIAAAADHILGYLIYARVLDEAEVIDLLVERDRRGRGPRRASC